MCISDKENNLNEVIEVAIIQENFQIADFILEVDWKFKIQYNFQYVFGRACYYKFIDTVEWYMRRDTQDFNLLVNEMLNACYHGNLQVVEILCSNYPQLCRIYNDTPMRMAAENNQNKVIFYLMDKGNASLW